MDFCNTRTEIKIRYETYYPFGLTMKGISSNAMAFGNPRNKYKFNDGTELASHEFSDGSGLEWYETPFRSYDPQLGRFHQIDALGDLSKTKSPYTYGSNSPITVNDPLGLSDSIPKVSTLPVLVFVGYTKIKDNWDNFSNWFNGANVNYSGSGWGHGPRRWISEGLGLGNNASNLFELGLHSQLQSSQVNLIGGLLENIKEDPAMIVYQNKIINILKADPRFSKMSFSIAGKDVLEFGGKRAPAPMNQQLKNPLNPAYADTWKVAMSTNTWSVRHAGVSYNATVKSDGIIVIDFKLNDTFDLRPGGNHTNDYNRVTRILGAGYHDFLGGNDKMKLNASWTVEIK